MGIRKEVMKRMVGMVVRKIGDEDDEVAMKGTMKRRMMGTGTVVGMMVMVRL